LPQLAVENFPSQIFWILVGFAIIYIFVSQVVTPGIERILGNRVSHIEDLVKNAKDLNSEAEKLEHEAFVSLENAAIEAEAAESKLISCFREQSIAEKKALYEVFSQESRRESELLTKTAADLFEKMSAEIEDVTDLAMKRIACNVPTQKKDLRP
jgi:F-type H+-transporting ATPase subunit b